MPHQFSNLLFTPSVQDVQHERGSRAANQKLTERGPSNDRFGPAETTFIAARDGFYMATIGETGWPYIQFRGGPPGFLRVRDDRTLAFADVTGNRQYISTGNLRVHDRIALFLMDYPHQTRLKILGHVEIIPWNAVDESDADLPLDPKSRPERVIRIHLDAFDWNCPQHIPQRWTVDELKQTDLFQRIQDLQEENDRLRSALAVQTPH